MEGQKKDVYLISQRGVPLAAWLLRQKIKISKFHCYTSYYYRTLITLIDHSK